MAVAIPRLTVTSLSGHGLISTLRRNLSAASLAPAVIAFDERALNGREKIGGNVCRLGAVFDFARRFGERF